MSLIPDPCTREVLILLTFLQHLQQTSFSTIEVHGPPKNIVAPIIATSRVVAKLL